MKFHSSIPLLYPAVPNILVENDGLLAFIYLLIASSSYCYCPSGNRRGLEPIYRGACGRMPGGAYAFGG